MADSKIRRRSISTARVLGALDAVRELEAKTLGEEVAARLRTARQPDLPACSAPATFLGGPSKAAAQHWQLPPSNELRRARLRKWTRTGRTCSLRGSGPSGGSQQGQRKRPQTLR
jgi:hypothetical protein